MALNLERQFLFYGAYHSNPVNIVIHVTCVPVILMCMLLLVTNVEVLPVASVPEFLQIPNLPPNLGTIAGLLYAFLYVLMEPVAGGLLAPLIVGGTAYMNHLSNTYGSLATKWSLVVQGVAWILQFVGHGVFEGRAPALLDNLVQALFLAPLFVWVEVLFALGYRPALKARIDKAIAVEIEKFKKGKEGKK